MFRSIRWTLQLWHAAILAVALSSFGTALYLGVSSAQFRRVNAELEGAARVLAAGPMGPMGGRFFDGGGRGGPGGGPDRGGPGRPQRPDFAPGGGRGAAYGNRPATAPFNSATPIDPDSLDRADGPDRGGGPDHGRPGPDHGSGRGGPRPPNQRGDWWTEVPRDALRRIGENEQDQPYFSIWGIDGEVIRASEPTLDVPTAADIAAAGSAIDVVGGFQPPFAPQADPVFRQRGDRREVILPGPFGMHVLVGKSTHSEQAALRQLRWILFAAGAAVMAIGLCGGWLLSERAIRPIKSISKTARAISGSDLGQRIAIDDTSSELGSLAQTLNATFDRLEDAFQRQVRFTADASHELRTPLSVIHSHTELALGRERSPAEYKLALETCLRAARRMRSLVESLLVLARADAGKLNLQCECFNLQAAAEECVAMLAARAEERHVTIDRDLQPITMNADRTRIMQLFTNLLGNAIQYNRDSGRVRITVSQEANNAVISVADTGVGISEEDQPRVFERFFRADKARSREAGGSGLGLAICQSIIEAHHGTITFQSKPNEGTTFTVRLPISREIA